MCGPQHSLGAMGVGQQERGSLKQESGWGSYQEDLG